MGAKKKVKTNKLARMSEEEKLRYLQHRAAIEEEARRRKEQLISTFMKNKLKHEDAFSRLNSAKINQQWRQSLRQIKNNELHEGAETLRQTFNVALETKNKIIDTLLSDLDDSVAMHNLAVQTHLESINNIIGIQEERLRNLHSSYLEERERKLKEAEMSRSHSVLTYKNDKKKLENDIFWQKYHHDKSYGRLQTLSQCFNNDCRNQLLSEMRIEEERSAKVIEGLRKDMWNILENYENTLKPYIDHYKRLREADMNDMILHVENFKIINEKEIYYKKLLTKLNSKSHLLQTTTSDLKSILNEEKNFFKNWRIAVISDQRKHEKSINYLSTVSTETIKYFDSLLDKVIAILHLNNSCKKLLTEKEMFTFCFRNSNICEKLDNKECEDISHNFWRAYSEVLVEVTSLSAHYANYMDENINLKHSLVKYMNTVSKPSSLASCLIRDI